MKHKGKPMTINGLKVVDAKKSIHLVITKGDVKKGKVKDPSGCAAAVACRRALKAHEARVHIGRTYLRFNGKWERYHTSPALRAEIVAFDRGGVFEPGIYTLQKMQPSKKSGKRQGAEKWRTGGRGKKRGRYHILTNIRPMGLTA